MCVTVSKYQSTINKLETDIYPAFDNALNAFDKTISGTFSGVTEEIIPAIQKEFRKLKVFEKKVIFPHVLSLFDENLNKNIPPPAIREIINYTNDKEEWLKKSIELIGEVFLVDRGSDINRSNEELDVAQKLHHLVHLFYNRFIPAKQLWNDLLVHLETKSPNCNNRMKGKCKYSADNEKSFSKQIHIHHN